jgi:hypothetical protein
VTVTDKSEALNPKFETNPNDQNLKRANGKKRMRSDGFEHSLFGF